ncbi:MAG: hypothetical protein AABZ57_03250 [Candidatus Margulisiibacteriota bacterium]
MNYKHKELAEGRWGKFSLAEQMGNIGSEISRTISWKKKENTKLSSEAFERALELSDLTIGDPKNIKRLKEICRMREALVDYFMYNNEYGSSDENWMKYFDFFAFEARAGK